MEQAMSSETEALEQVQEQDTTISFKSVVTITPQGMSIENVSNMSPLAQLGCVDLIRESIIAKHFPSKDAAQQGDSQVIEQG